jgi:Arc/MetJ-type ribon-helix-helix transcriptional regulator
MTYSFPQDLQRLVDARMATGQYPTEDDVLRGAMHALRDEQEDLEAVRAALAQLQADDVAIPDRLVQADRQGMNLSATDRVMIAAGGDSLDLLDAGLPGLW